MGELFLPRSGGKGFDETGARYDAGSRGNVSRKPMVIEGELIAKSTGTNSDYSPGDRVFHQKFGYGTIAEIGEGAAPETVAPEQTLAEQLEGLPHDELVRIVETMEEDMRNASAAMDFEEAARLRDAVVQIRAMLEGASEDETIERLRSQARKGSTFASGRKRQGARFRK